MVLATGVYGNQVLCNPTADMPPVQSHWLMLCISSRPLMHPHTHHHHVLAAALLTVSAGVTGCASRPPVSGPLSPNTGHCRAGLALSSAPVQRGSCGSMTTLQRCRQACWLPFNNHSLVFWGSHGFPNPDRPQPPIHASGSSRCSVVVWGLFQRESSTIWTSTNEAIKQSCITLCS